MSIASRHTPTVRTRFQASAFTLTELLVVTAVICLALGMLLPALHTARRHAREVTCLANLRLHGLGMAEYIESNNGLLAPAEFPVIDETREYGYVFGKKKFRPTFLMMMNGAIWPPAFNDSDLNDERDHGRLDYVNRAFVCPSVSDWTDERNAGYGYNYQFLGNTRKLADGRMKNWPVRLIDIQGPDRTLAITDSMGTAASWPKRERQAYRNNSDDLDRYGNLGYLLDPPWLDPVNGEMAAFDHTPPARTAAHARHRGKACVLWVDSHISPETMDDLGYVAMDNDQITFSGSNQLWTGSEDDHPWSSPNK